MRGLLRGAWAIAVVTALASCGGDTNGGGQNDADAAASSGGSGGSAGAATGGNSGAGGASSGSGGTAPSTGGRGSECPPECFAANHCVETCGDEPMNYGCCACPAGTINVLSCNAMGDGGSGAVSCDPRSALCRALPPPCPEGQVPSVENTCWGPCVPIATCVCGAADDCPEPEQYTCHLNRGRCDYYVR